MTDTRVQYMGIELKNPLVVSSSSLTDSAAKVKKCEEHGAGAVVLKSLFEEEIQAEITSSMEGAEHTEAIDYIREIQTGAGLKRYTTLIRDAKAAVSIPVIASVNAVTHNWWEKHVPSLAEAGADAIELNISLMPYDYKDSEEAIIDFYVNTVETVCKSVDIPVTVKIGYHFTAIPAVVDALAWAGAQGVVLFNRFYQLDIDITKLELKSGSPMSKPSDLALPLRWITMLYGKSNAELAASSGIHRGTDAVKVLLAGAQVAYVCSTIYKNGYEHLEAMQAELVEWMAQQNFTSIPSFRGRLSQKRSDKPESFERLQYIQALVGQS